MEKRDYKIRAIDTNGKEIDFGHEIVYRGITMEMAECICMGLEIGLMQKYKKPTVNFWEL